MAYDPTVWKDRVVERPMTFNIVNNPDGTITLVPAPGVIAESGTPVNAANLNKLEQGLRSHEAEIATKDELGHIKLDGLLKTGLNADMLDGKHSNDFLQSVTDVFVVGTYIGDRTSSREISLGFRPKAVLVFDLAGRTSSGTGVSTRYVGGLALDGHPVIKGSDGDDIVSITSNGFTVYYSASEYIHSNDSGAGYNPYRYIAFK